MNIPSPDVIRAPDASKGLSGLRAFSGGGALEPASGLIEGVTAGNSILGLIKVVSFWLARGIILPAELMLRRQIGERYISAPVIAAFIGALCLLVFAPTIPPNQQYLHFVNQYRHIIVGFIVGAFLVVHLAKLRVAQKKGEHWHSYSEGQSWLDFPRLQNAWVMWQGPFTTVNVAKNFLEPLSIVLMAFLLFPAAWTFLRYHNGPNVFVNHAPYFTYWILVAFTMALYQFFCSRIRRGQLLDHLDSQLMMEAQVESEKKDKPPGLRDFYGVSVLGPSASIQWAPSAPTAASAAVSPILRVPELPIPEAPKPESPAPMALATEPSTPEPPAPVPIAYEQPVTETPAAMQPEPEPHQSVLPTLEAILPELTMYGAPPTVPAVIDATPTTLPPATPPSESSSPEPVAPIVETPSEKEAAVFVEEPAPVSPAVAPLPVTSSSEPSDLPPVALPTTETPPVEETVEEPDVPAIADRVPRQVVKPKKRKRKTQSNSRRSK